MFASGGDAKQLALAIVTRAISLSSSSFIVPPFLITKMVRSQFFGRHPADENDSLRTADDA